MKKLLTIIIVAGMTTFFACGPSAKEKAEKVKQDSIAKVDSIKDKFIGIWRQINSSYSIPYEIIISRNGDLYVMKDYGVVKGFGVSSFTFSNGILKGENSLDNITYGADNDHIFYRAIEWARIK